MKAQKEKENLMSVQEQFVVEVPEVKASSFQSELLSEKEAFETQAYRAGTYDLLAALLRSPPKQDVLDYIASLSANDSEGSELAVSLSMLRLAVANCDLDAIDDEYHALFIGLGRGEVMPYGSWYQTGFLMEKPLGILRNDLSILGFERNTETHEPEDHIAALSEVMSLMINGQIDQSEALNLVLQQQFFDAHISCWADKFYADLSEASSAVFYRSVGRLGSAFIDFEKKYLSMSV